MKKKILLSLSAGSISVLPIVSVVACAPMGGYTSFTGIGSNSVSPLIKEGKFGQMKNIVAPYSYDNSGSGAGFGSQAGAIIKADFGMSSSLKLPGTQNEDKYGTHQSQIDHWANNQIRTVTWAIDAIGVAVNLPGQLTTNGTPQIDATYLAKVYNGENVTWSDLLINETSTENSNVIPVYIAGGTETSGKSEAFVKGMIKAAKGDSKYGSAGSTSIDKEKFENHEDLTGNHGHPDSFTDLLNDNNKNDGTIMYYSLGQINAEMNNSNSNNHSNLLMAAVKGFGSDTKSPTAEMVRKGVYSYTRPFNIMYDVRNYKSISFASWLLGKEFQDQVNGLFVSLPKTKVVLEQSNTLTMPDFKRTAKAYGLYDKPTTTNAGNIHLGLDISNLGSEI